MASTFTAGASARLVAVRRFKGYNITAPGADAEILSTGLKFDAKAPACRLTIALTVSSVLNVTVTDGSTEHKWGLNESVALNAGDLYSFFFPVMDNDSSNDLTYNFEVESDGVIEQLIVDEIQGAVS